MVLTKNLPKQTDVENPETVTTLFKQQSNINQQDPATVRDLYIMGALPTALTI